MYRWLRFVETPMEVLSEIEAHARSSVSSESKLNWKENCEAKSSKLDFKHELKLYQIKDASHKLSYVGEKVIKTISTCTIKTK